MALQTSNLIMVGLGTLRDAPPNSEQPPLSDAIHLRWVFKRDLGFPWFGFYLFRRLHQRGNLSRLSQHTGHLQKGTWTSNTLETPLAQVSSDTNLVMTEDFPPPASVEFDLADRGYLRVTFPPQEPVRHVETHIGFRSRPGDPPPTRKSVSFTAHSVSRGPNPRTESDVVFETRDRSDRPRPNTFIRSVKTSSGPINGLGCKFKLNITLPQPSTFVEVTLTGAARRDRPEGTPTIEAFNQDGTRADSAAMHDPGSREPETFLLTGAAITRVVIDEQSLEGQDDQDRVILNELSYGTAAISEVHLTAFAAATPVHRVAIRGYAGRVVATEIDFEGISAVELSSAAAALIDLGTVPLAQDATSGWERLREFPYPMRLPITHPDYPCTPQINEDAARARQLAADRIQYGSPKQFTSLPVSIPNAGTISITNGSPIVLGAGTNWNQGLLDAVLQVSGDTTVYTVVMVVSPTKLVLSRNYSGTSRSAAQYTISRDTFGQFYSYLANLVAGGRAAGPMARRTMPAPVTTLGTVSVSDQSPTIQGTGTAWVSNLVGLDFQLEGEQAVYTIATVDSSTQLTLARSYLGQSNSGRAYRICGRMQAPAAGEMVPRMPDQSPLDMVLLGSLHPAVAEMSGLHWSDRTTDPDQTYDYLIVGDYEGIAELNPDKMLAVLRQNGFSSIDGSIVYNMRMVQAPPLPGPDRLELYALPGSSRRTESGSSEESINNVGLRWDLNKTELGVLLPGRAVMYHLWRAKLGNGATPATTIRYDLLSRQSPVLVVETGAPQRTAPDWPPFSLHAIDNALADGWYGYQVSGIDIFGRHSSNSSVGVWRQWTPLPEPRPWYYVDPPSDAVIHASAIRLLTKTAPPPPTGVEAFALDPADPTVIKDAAYSAWLGRIQNKNLIGLRVRWVWPNTHLAQAPHTREFRIYYERGHLNALLGNTRAVAAAGNAESDITTDIPNSTPADSYVGASLHAAQDAFVIVGSQAGSPLRVRVRNVGPNRDIRPEINAPCTIAIAPIYSAGTASVWSGSKIVTGVGTGWTTPLAGMLFQIPTDERSYRIARVDSETQLTLDQPYSGVTRSKRVYSIRHPRFVDYSRVLNWQRRYYVVNLDQHWTAGTDAEGRPVRRYEIFLPAPEDSVQEGVPLIASRSEPLVYANIGVSAADDKSHTPDDPKWTGPWAGRPGNEGRVGPPAKIFRVLREPPPVPLLPRMPERMLATRADQNGVSFYTFRWQPLDETKLHVFRAFDDALFTVDWSQRPRPALDATMIELFPSESIDGRWTSGHRQQVATKLNQLNNFGRDEVGTVQAFAYYRDLSADALRVLAGLPGNDAAFTQVTIAALDPPDPAWTNRRGPDDPDNFQIGDSNNPLASPLLRIFIDTLDGRTTNRYFYRAVYVDAAHNRSAYSLATPPVFVPKVVAPQPPLVQLALAADGKVRLQWMTSPESDVVRYLIYRTSDHTASRDIRTMTLVARVVARPSSSPLPGEEIPTEVPDKPWLEYQDPAPPRQTFFYRLVSVDTSGNHSESSEVLSGSSYPSPPASPTLDLLVWDPTHKKVTLVWTASDPQLASLVERRQHSGPMWSTPVWVAATGWLPRGIYSHIDEPPDPSVRWEYRIKVRDIHGQVIHTQQTQITP